MLRQRTSPAGTPISSAVAAIAMLALLHAPLEGAADEISKLPCGQGNCVVIEYDEDLAREAATLADALMIRLGKYDLAVVVGGGSFEPAPQKTAAIKLWVVHLKRLAGESILVAVDNRATDGGDDVVKEVEQGETAESTAWTMAIMIEEAVMPYLADDPDHAALGAGLAIIEPPVVGGFKKAEPVVDPEYPRVRSIGLSLTVYGITEAENFVFGPRFALEGLFAKRVTVSISAAWAGWADFVSHGVGGSVSLIPLDVMFGFVLLPNRIIELSVHAGFAVGFAVYKTSRDERDRTDLLFEPCGQAALRAIFHVFGPWTVFVDGGLAVPFVKDVLRNQGQVVFEQEWGFPVFNVGIQMWL